MASTDYSPPSSILIVGSGVFGLSTAHALATRPLFSSTRITVVDRPTSAKRGSLPSGDAASMDSSRIIRADYADGLYTQLAAEAQEVWRQTGDEELGGGGRYTESGMLVLGEVGVNGGMGYVKDSHANVLGLAKEMGLEDKVVEVGSPEALRNFLGTEGASGDWGYLNKLSGWANAELGMEWMMDKVQRTKRVEFVNETVASLVWDAEQGRVMGVRTEGGERLTADLVIAAAGAWTGGLVDLGGLCTATGQVVAYMDITDEEEKKLGDRPVLLNLSSGLFIIPPRNRVLKAARHAYGYLNPVDLPSSRLLPKKVPQASESTSADTSDTVRVSLPRTHVDEPDMTLPAEAETDLRRALRQFIPLPSIHDRPFKSCRICWYSDTPTGDFLIDYHPAWKGLFVATGGSGHGYKFLPVLGDKIVDCIAGEGADALRAKWRWREGDVCVVDGVEVVASACEDGSRGGVPGMMLENEVERKM